MDEEQGLVSPIAGGIRGIRRSVSSSIFTGRAVPPPQPDPQTTRLLDQNSLTLSTVSGQLSNISSQVSSLNDSLGIIRENLAVSDQIDRQREAAKQRREAILAEQGLREGKESELERKVQTALLTPVRKVATFARGILSRLTDFLLILAGGWLTDKVLSFIRLSSEGNLDKLNEFKRKFLKSLLVLGAIGLTLSVGIGKLVATVGSISGLALKFAFSTLLVAPFKAAIRFIRGNVENFVKNFKNYAKNLLRKGPGKLLSFLNPKNLLLGGGVFGMGQGLGINKKIGNFFRSITGRKLLTESAEQATKAGTKKALAKGMLGPAAIALEPVFALFDFFGRKREGQSNKEAGIGAGGAAAGGLAGTFLALTLVPEPISSGIGLLGLTILGIGGYTVGSMAGGKIGDELSGLNQRKRDEASSGSDGVTTYDAVEGRADGGPVDAGKPYVVGEKGPELFSSDVAGMITPLNLKKDLKISDLISSLDQSPQVTVIPLNGAKKGISSKATMTKTSSMPSDSLPNIPSSDFANNFVGLSESMYNVVV